MAKEKKLTKVHPQIRIGKADLKDLIRDLLYGYGGKDKGEVCIDGIAYLQIPAGDVKKIAKKIAARAVIGH